MSNQVPSWTTSPSSAISGPTRACAIHSLPAARRLSIAGHGPQSRRLPTSERQFSASHARIKDLHPAGIQTTNHGLVKERQKRSYSGVQTTGHSEPAGEASRLPDTDAAWSRDPS